MSASGIAKRIVSGQVALSGATQLTSSSFHARELVITTAAAAAVYVGPSGVATTTGVLMPGVATGRELKLCDVDPSKVYVVGTDTQVVTFIATAAE